MALPSFLRAEHVLAAQLRSTPQDAGAGTFIIWSCVLACIGVRSRDNGFGHPWPM
jgi:hypothetical protein